MSEINVSSVLSTYSDLTTNKTAKTEAKTDSKADSKAKKSEEEKEAEETGVVYEKSSGTEKSATYTINKMSAEDRAALVQQLKQDDEERRNQLSTLVQQMFSQQGTVSDLAKLFTEDKLKEVSAADIAQAKEDVSEDGYWGITQTSQRLFDFASALAGDDVDKMKEMQEAMLEGFKEATSAWGEDLPELCQNTLDAANKLFEDYYASKSESAE